MAIVTFCAVTLVAPAIASWPRPEIGLAVGAPVAVVQAVFSLLFKVRVKDDGVLLYGLHWLPWSDVLEAKRYPLPVFPYLVVRRRRGFRWWIPLYFQGERDLVQVLVEKSPPDNPIRFALTAG